MWSDKFSGGWATKHQFVFKLGQTSEDNVRQRLLENSDDFILLFEFRNKRQNGPRLWKLPSAPQDIERSQRHSMLFSKEILIILFAIITVTTNRGAYSYHLFHLKSWKSHISTRWRDETSREKQQVHSIEHEENGTVDVMKRASSKVHWM